MYILVHNVKYLVSGQTCLVAMRRLLIAAIPFLLAGCSQPQGEVRLQLASDKALAVDEFEVTKIDPSYCSVRVSITYDISVEPKNFTGVAYIKDAQLEWAGWKSKKQLFLQFIDGKQIGSTLNESESVDVGDSKEKIEAICRVKSSSDVKIVDLGKPMFAFYGVKASANKAK